MSAADPKVVDFKTAKKNKERQKYNALVMQTFKDMEHADRRAFLEKKAEIEHAGRERL